MSELLDKLLHAAPQLGLGLLFIVALVVLLKEYRSLRGDIKTTVDDTVSARLGALLGNLQVDAAAATRILGEINEKDLRIRKLSDNFEAILTEHQKRLDAAWSRMHENLQLLATQADSLASLSAQDVVILARRVPFTDVETMLQRVFESVDATATDLVSAGNVARDRRKLQLAERLYARATERDPEDSDARIQHLCLQAEISPRLREDALREATRIVMQSLDVRFETRLANALIFLDRYAQLQSLCQDILEKQPPWDSPIYAQASRDRGVALRHLGDLSGAQRCLQAALDAAPDDENVIKAFLPVLRAAKDHEQLLAFAKRLILLDPLDGYYYSLMGEALVALGRVDEAINWYEKAIDVTVEEGKKEVARREVRKLRARQELQDFIELGPLSRKPAETRADRPEVDTGPAA